MRRYWGISRVWYRGAWRWLAQKSLGRKRLWKTGFQDEIAAATWLAKQLGVTRTSLQRHDKFLVTTSVYKGVVPRLVGERGAIRWIARAGTSYVGTFKTEKRAAKAIAKQRGVAFSKLRRKQGGSGRRGVISAPRARALFKGAYRQFKKYQAGDYVNMLEIESKAAMDFKQDYFGCT